MPDSTRSLDTELTALADDFDIVGELARGTGTQYLIATRKATAAKRRDDSSRVLIEIARPPEGDESHALDHLASDTKLLSNLRHRRLVSVYEGRWVGDDAFAVVREYVDDPTAGDLMARGQHFTNTRTAAILREVHGLLQWAREQNVVHRHVTPDRLFLEPTSDRVRVTFGAGPVQRVRTVDATTEDVITVVRLAKAMLTGDLPQEEVEGRSFADVRPDLPERLHEETARLLVEPATDHDLTLYLALIGMADPVAEGETERDRIRAEVLEEQRVEREKLANERAELEKWATEERAKLAEEGEELRGAFAQEKAKLEREFAAAQRLLAAERVEMQRIIAAERAELTTKRETLEKLVSDRLAEIEKAAAADRAAIDALRAKIQADGEMELERKRAAALEDLDDSEIRLFTGKYATPRFVTPELDPLPSIAFRRDEHLGRGSRIDEPALPAEPWSVVDVVKKLREPRRTPFPWRRWVVGGGIAAAILLTAGYAIMVESRTPVVVDTRGASAPAVRVIPEAGRPAGSPPAVAPAPAAGAPATPPTDSAAPAAGALPATTGTAGSPTGAPTYSSAGGAVGAPVVADSVAAKARRDSIRRAILARAQATRANMGLTRPDSTTRPASDPVVKRAPGSLQDLMDLSDSLSGSGTSQSSPSSSSPR
jgi:serine/threonine protein kinase